MTAAIQINSRRFCLKFLFLIRLVALICPLILSGLVGSIPAAAAQQDRWAGDVPIMDGLVVEPELGFAFDSPSGRIVMIFVSTNLSAEDLHNFYDSALAGLGWSGGQGEWRRGSEKLSIEQVKTAAGMLWRIMVSPG